MMKHLYFLGILLACVNAPVASYAQMNIIVPTGTDTVVCPHQCVTLQASNIGYTVHSLTSSDVDPSDFDDGFSKLIPLGFSFYFYGKHYAHCVISTNGFITFDTTNADGYSEWDIPGYGGIPGNSKCRNAVLGIYSDILLSAGGNLYYGTAGTAPNRKFVVTFCNAHMYSCTTQYTDFQIILYESTNVAEVHIHTKSICSAWNSGAGIEGVQNASGTRGKVAPGRNYPGTWTAHDDGRRFSIGSTDSTYVCDTIPYAPIVSTTATIHWYRGNTLIGTGDTVTVCPDTTTTYRAVAYYCDDTVQKSVTVVVGTGGPVTITSTNPTMCGDCDGTIKLHGLAPGQSDTIYYSYNGVAQPMIVDSAAADSTITFTGLCAGIYDSFAVVAGLCTHNSPDSAILVDPPFTISSVSFQAPTVCGLCNGSVTLHGLVPGYVDTINYQYNGVAQTALDLTVAADGTVTITGLCSGVYDSFTAKMNDCITPPAGPVTLPVAFFGISAITTANPTYCGGCNGTLTIHGLIPGFTDTINYHFNGIPQSTVIALVDSDSTITLSGLCAGTYDSITAKMNDCITAPAGPNTLANPPISISAVDYTDPTACSACNGTITLHGLLPGFTDTLIYEMDGSPQTPIVVTIPADSTITLTSLCAGTYSQFIATMSPVCITPPAGPKTLILPPAPDVYLADSTMPTECGACNGVIVLKGGIPFTTDTLSYNYNGANQVLDVTVAGDSSITLLNLCAGSYTNFYLGDGPCSAPIPGSVTLTTQPILAAFTDTTHYGCHGDTVFFTNQSTSGGKIRYFWTFGDGATDTVANPVHIYTAQGTDTVKMLAYHLCADSATATVTFYHPIHADFSLTPDTFCQGQAVVFSDSSVAVGPSYLWSFGDGTHDTALDPTHVYANSGTYHVTLVVTDFVPCHDTAYATIYADSISGVTLSLTDSVLCGAVPISFTATYLSYGNTGLQWNFGDGDSIANVNPVSHSFAVAGAYTVRATATYRRCRDTSAYRNVVIEPYPVMNLGMDTSICPGGIPISLYDYANAANSAATWLWSTGDTTAGIIVTAPGTYYATVAVHGCSASDTVVVYNNCYMDIPNAFSPNNDGVNDYFFPRQFLSRGLLSFQMEIYNRWGQEVFTTQSTDGRGWDGKFNGVDQPEGVYIYVIDASFIDGQKVHRKGNVTLLR
jgi:gliding motility-associated-like protein